MKKIKWIAFKDLMPPIGMNIIMYNGRGEFAVQTWSKDLIRDPSQFITAYVNTWNQPREVYDFNWWIPVSFIDTIYPKESCDGNELIDEKENWYMQNINCSQITKISKLTDELNNLSEEVAKKWYTHSDSGITHKQQYSSFLLYKISNLYNEINNN